MLPEKVEHWFVRYHEVHACEAGADDMHPGCGKMSIVAAEYADGSVWLCNDHYMEARVSDDACYNDPDCGMEDYDYRNVPTPPYAVAGDASEREEGMAESMRAMLDGWNRLVNEGTTEEANAEMSQAVSDMYDVLNVANLEPTVEALDSLKEIEYLVPQNVEYVEDNALGRFRRRQKMEKAYYERIGKYEEIDMAEGIDALLDGFSEAVEELTAELEAIEAAEECAWCDGTGRVPTGYEEGNAFDVPEEIDCVMCGPDATMWQLRRKAMSLLYGKAEGIVDNEEPERSGDHMGGHAEAEEYPLRMSTALSASLADRDSVEVEARNHYLRQLEFWMSEANRLQAELASRKRLVSIPKELTDEGCFMLPNGECVGDGPCIHTP